MTAPNPTRPHPASRCTPAGTNHPVSTVRKPHAVATPPPTSRGGGVVAVYRDVAPTGGWRAIRPGLRHLLDAAASGAFDLLLVHQLDRLSRRMEHVEQVVEELDTASVAVPTVREPFDSAAPANRLILRLWPAFAEYDATSTWNADTSNGSRPDTAVPPPRSLHPARHRRSPPKLKRRPYRARPPAVN
jgi:hypothetical protein